MYINVEPDTCSLDAQAKPFGTPDAIPKVPPLCPRPPVPPVCPEGCLWMLLCEVCACVANQVRHQRTQPTHALLSLRAQRMADSAYAPGVSRVPPPLWLPLSQAVPPWLSRQRSSCA